MEKFNFKVTKDYGLHARPAGQLVNIARKFDSIITIINGKKSASATGLFALMGLGVQSGDDIIVECNGDDEKAAREEIENFFKNNFSKTI